MARIRDPARDKAFELWKEAGGEKAPKGILKKIADELGKSETLIRKWKNIDRWNNVGNISNDIPKSNVTKSNGNVTNEKNKINWLKLENEYVTDITQKVTLKALSKKYNISFNTVEDYSKKNNWKEKRKKYHGNVTEKIQEKLADETSDVMADILNNINTALLQATEELHIHEEVNGFGQLISIPTSTVRTAKLGRLVKAITAMQKIENEKLQMQFEKEKFVINSELKRLELECNKTENGEIEEDTEEFDKDLKEWTDEVWK